MTDFGDVEFKIDYMPAVAEQLRSITAPLNAVRRRQYIREFHQIVDQLRKDPAAWGDPLRLTILEGGVEYHGLRRPFHVRYAIYVESLLVVILSVELYPKVDG